MKKAIFVFIFLIVANTLFANALDLTGRDWVKMDYDQKTYLIAGMFMGFDIVRTAISEIPTNSTAKDEYGYTVDDYLHNLSEFFYLNTDVATIIKQLDAYYSNPNNLRYYIWSSIFAIYNKTWW